MILLISMSECLLAWDAAEPHAWRVHEGCGVYYGIAFNDDCIFAAARRFSLHSSEADAARSNGVILVFDSRLNLRREIAAPFPLRDIHQILWDSGRLFVAASYDDLVAVREDGVWRAWTPLEPRPRRERPSGGRHYNSLLRQGDELYLLAHNFGASEVFVFNATTLALRRSFPLGNFAHNLWFDGGSLLTCSSGEGRILSPNGIVVETGNFPRGIVAAPDRRFAGISTFQESREERGFHDAFLVQYDPQWRPLRKLLLRGMGMLHDLRCPGVPDAAHPHLVGPAVDLTEVKQRCEAVPFQEVE